LFLASKVESLIDEGMLEFCRFVVKSTRHNFAEDYFDACKKIDPIENQISWFESIEELLNTQVGLNSYSFKHALF
jgi:hypothetical protein